MTGVKARVEEFEKGDKSQIPDHPQPSSQGEDVKRHTRGPDTKQVSTGCPQSSMTKRV